MGTGRSSCICDCGMFACGSPSFRLFMLDLFLLHLTFSLVIYCHPARLFMLLSFHIYHRLWIYRMFEDGLLQFHRIYMFD